MAVYHGSQGELQINGTAVGYVTGISFDIASNREPVWEMGSRKFVEMKSGNLEITGSVDELYQDNDWATEVAKGTPSEYTITCRVQDSGGSGYDAQLDGVIFTDLSYELPEDDLVNESLDFQARDITLSSV